MNAPVKKDRTGCIVFVAVAGAFVMLIAAWIVFFWIASHNRVQEIPLDDGTTAPVLQTQMAPVEAGVPAAEVKQP